VRSTTNDLNLVEAALTTLSAPATNRPSATNVAPVKPPSTNSAPQSQVDIKVKIVELDETTLKKTGVDWLFADIPGWHAVTNQPPPPGLFPTRDPAVAKVFSNPARPVTNSILSQSCGILTRVQFHNKVTELMNLAGVDMLNAPEVTTANGREAEVPTGNAQTIVTGLEWTPDGKGSGTNNYLTTSMLFGPTVDLVPNIAADGKSIELKVTSSVTEFIGYDDPVKSGVKPDPTHVPGAVVPLPHFRLRQMTTDTTVEDGHTLVLSGVEAERLNVVKDKVPFLGSMPLLGRLFQSTTIIKSRKNLLIFITPTVINGEGMPINGVLYDPLAR